MLEWTSAQPRPQLLPIWLILRALQAKLGMGPGSGSRALPSAWEKGEAAGTQSTKGPAISPAWRPAHPTSARLPQLQPSTGNAGVERKGHLGWALRDQRKWKVQGREPHGQPRTLENHSLTQRWKPPDLQLAVPTTQHFSSKEGFNFLFLLSRVRYVTANQSFPSA